MSKDTLTLMVPMRVARIVMDHIRPLVREIAIDALSNGRDPLMEVARSCYLQGFKDAAMRNEAAALARGATEGGT